jgi:hypothetical protein
MLITGRSWTWVSNSCRDKRLFCLLRGVQNGSGALQGSYKMDTGGVTRPDLVTDHSSPSSAEIKNAEAGYLLPHTSFLLDASLFQHIDNFILKFPLILSLLFI